jgi:hypothetical protein
MVCDQIKKKSSYNIDAILAAVKLMKPLKAGSVCATNAMGCVWECSKYFLLSQPNELT